jgi:hypothetical protein
MQILDRLDPIVAERLDDLEVGMGAVDDAARSPSRAPAGKGSLGLADTRRAVEENACASPPEAASSRFASTCSGTFANGLASLPLPRVGDQRPALGDSCRRARGTGLARGERAGDYAAAARAWNPSSSRSIRSRSPSIRATAVWP